MKKNNKLGFTLLELMLVIAIIGIISTLISGNFFVSFKRGRDARRKADLKEVKNAIELYYEDNGEYPEPTYIQWGSEFSKDGKVYFKKLPKDPSSNCSYKYIRTSDGNFFLLSIIENPEDNGPGVSQTGYENPDGIGKLLCDSSSCICKFYIGSPNGVLNPAQY